MLAEELFKLIEALYPLSLQENYDNSGPQVIPENSDIRTALLTLDVTMDTVLEAERTGASLILSHHPVIFRGIKSILPGDPLSSVIMKLIKSGIGVYSAHTNLDRVFCRKLESVLGLKHIRVLFGGETLEDGRVTGFGTLSETEPVSLRGFLENIAGKLEAEHLAYCGDDDRVIKRAALLNGSGGKAVAGIAASGEVDCIVTGDVGYHAAMEAAAHGVAVIDAGHYHTEKLMLRFLMDELHECLTKNGHDGEIRLIMSTQSKNPFKVYFRQ